MTDTRPKIDVLTQCPAHGEKAWRGHLFCDKCSLLFSSRGQNDLLLRAISAPKCDKCGRDLLPMCAECFESIDRHGMQFVLYPDLTDVPDDLLSDVGRNIKSQQASKKRGAE